MNATARGVGLETEGAIGRALIQTEAAMNALVQFGDVECDDFFAWFAVASRVDGFQLQQLLQFLASTSCNWALESAN